MLSTHIKAMERREDGGMERGRSRGGELGMIEGRRCSGHGESRDAVGGWEE